jgi:hypothetical protein
MSQKLILDGEMVSTTFVLDYEDGKAPCLAGLQMSERNERGVYEVWAGYVMIERMEVDGRTETFHARRLP